MKKMTNIVDRLVTTGSTQMRKYVNVKIMDFKNKSRELFPDIPTESVVVFRDVHQMADIIFGKHLAKSLAAWDARINDRIATHENKVFRHCLRDLQLSSNSGRFKSRASKHEVPEDNGEDEGERLILWRKFCGQVATGYGNWYQLVAKIFALNYIVKKCQRT